jgi:molecular chaperone HscB
MPPPAPNLPPDAFDALGVPVSFDLSIPQLRAAFLARSAAIHPDVAAGDSEADAAALNEAKRTLENPETRAELLLARLGGPRKEQDRSLPPSFLQEMLEVREAIDAAVESRDPGAIAKWEDWAEERRRAHIRAVADLFRAATGSPQPSPHPADQPSDIRRAIRMELNMWRYVERLIEHLEGGTSA